MKTHAEIAQQANETLRYVRNILDENALERSETLLAYPSHYGSFFTLLEQVNEMVNSLTTLQQEMRG